MSNLNNEFWNRHVTNRDPNAVIIGGEHFIYIDSDIEKGFSGKKFTIKMNSGKIISTNNLWHQGKIPQEYRELLPDNAEFIN